MNKSVDESSRDSLTDEGQTTLSIVSLVPPPDASGPLHSQNILPSLHVEPSEEPVNVQDRGITAVKGTGKGKGKDIFVHQVHPLSHDDLEPVFCYPPPKYRRKIYHEIRENDIGQTEEERRTALGEIALPHLAQRQSLFNENVRPNDTTKRTSASTRRRGLNTGTQPPTRTSARLRDKAALKSIPRDKPNATSPTTENLYRTPLQHVVVDLNGTARVEKASIELVGQCVMEPSSAYFGPQNNLPLRFRSKLMIRKR